MTRIPDLHKATAPKIIGIYIITCSTSKFNEQNRGSKPDDSSGDTIEQLAAAAGHRVNGRRLISDSRTMIQRSVRKALASKAVDAVVITGGTGLSPRDVTIESVRNIMEREIPGFGELFRKISYDEIGSAAMLSRAEAGSVNGKLVFCLPGSPDAVRTAMKELILPELGHMMRVIREHP